jgi:hypothetical protein
VCVKNKTKLKGKKEKNGGNEPIHDTIHTYMEMS